MKKLATAIAAIALIGTPAFAADMAVKAPPPVVAPAPVFSWTGFYIGGNAGGAWSRDDWQFVDTNPPGHTAIPAGFSEGSDTASGGIGGVQIGGNLQFSQWVVGAEFQWDWSDIKTQHLTPTFLNLLSTQVTSMGTLTGRVGYAWDRLLVYGKGGAAWVQDTYARGFGIPTGGFPAGTFFAQSQNNTVSGWTLGAGVEYALAPNWVVGVEYDYLQFGTHNFFFSNNAVANSLGFTPFSEHINQNVQMVTARLSFLFSIGPGFVLTR